MLPQAIEDSLKRWFSFPHNDIFCQVSTVSHHNQPHIRTMKLYDITTEGFPVVITSTDTQKWQDCEHYSHSALCLFNPLHGQLIMKGHVHLQSPDLKVNNLIQHYWDMLPPYWQDFYHAKNSNSQHLLNKIPNSFGIMIIEPHFWEILEIFSTDYLQSSRRQFHLIDDKWHMSEVEPV